MENKLYNNTEIGIESNPTPTLEWLINLSTAHVGEGEHSLKYMTEMFGHTNIPFQTCHWMTTFLFLALTYNDTFLEMLSH